MESLLRWGIENSTPAPEGTPVVPRNDLDPAIIDYILGKSDATLMKEALEVAVDEKQSEDSRVQALDDFEMLVENLDNANDIVKLKMWDSLQSLLISPTSSERIKTQTLWVIGTAVQNNPSAQAAYLSIDPISTILSFMSPSVESSQLRSKAVYALSGLCKHNATAVKQLEEAGGWEVFRLALEESDINVRRKTVFLLNSLLIPSGAETTEVGDRLHTQASAPAPIHPNSHASLLRDPTSMETSHLTLKALEEQGLLITLLNALAAPIPYGVDGESHGDADFEEKGVRLLCTYLTIRSGTFTKEVPQVHIVQFKQYVSEELDKAGGSANLAEMWGLSMSEFDGLMKALNLNT